MSFASRNPEELSKEAQPEMPHDCLNRPQSSKDAEK